MLIASSENLYLLSDVNIISINFYLLYLLVCSPPQIFRLPLYGIYVSSFVFPTREAFIFIADIESKLRQIEEDPEGSGTAHLHGATQKISEIANRAFQPLFERQVAKRIYL